MKHRILTVILLLAMAGGVIAQERDIQTIKPSRHSPYHNDITLTGGLVSLYGIFILNDGISYKPRPYMTSNKFHGAYGIQYHHNFKWWFQYGVKATAEFGSNFRYAEDRNTIAGYNQASLWTLMPSIRFTYVNTNWVRLYSGLDMGMAINYIHDKQYTPGHRGESAYSYFAVNINPIGINVGKRLYGMFEVNLGVASLLKFGIGYRF